MAETVRVVAPEKSNAFEWIVAALFILLGAAGLRVVEHPTFWNVYFFKDAPVGGVETRTIGTLEHKSGGVRYRPAGSPVWTDLAARKSQIHDGQYIFTDHTGGAIVQLDDGLTAEIQESSLIAIFASKQDSAPPLVQVKKGTAKLKLPAQLKRATLIIDGKVLDLKNTEGKAVELKVTRSQPQSNQDFEGTNIELTQGTPIEITQNGKSKLIRSGQTASLQLSIAPQTHTDSLLESITVPTQSSDHKPEEKVPPSPAPSQKYAQEMPQKIVLQTLTLNPSKMEEKSRLDEWVIPLKWQPVPGADSYHLEIVSESGVPVVSESVSQPNYNWKVTSLESRKFKYRVTAILTSSKSLGSDWERIELSVIPPVITGPSAGTTFNSGAPGRPPLTWNKTTLSTQYEIQLSQSAAFNAPVITHNSIQNFYVPEDLAEGLWHWRVRARVKGGVSEWSASQTFNWIKGESAPE